MTISTYSSRSSNKTSKLSLISILLLSLVCLLLRPVEITAKLGEGRVAVDTDVEEKDLTSSSISASASTTVEYSRARTTAGDSGSGGGSTTAATATRSLGVGYNKKPYQKPQTYKKPYRHHPNRKPVPKPKHNNNRQYYVKKPIETPPGGRHNGHYYIKVPVSKPTPHYNYNNNYNYHPKAPVYKPKPKPQSKPTKRPTKSPTKKPEPTTKKPTYSSNANAATPKPTQFWTPTGPTATPNAKTPQPTKPPTKKPTTVKPTTDKPTKRPTKKPTTSVKSDIPTDTPTLVVWPPVITSSPSTVSVPVGVPVVVEGKKIPPTFAPSGTGSPTINLPPAARTPPQPEKQPVVVVVPVEIDDTEPSKIQLRIQDFVLNGGEEFNDPTSYQSFALRRVEEQVNANDMTTIKLLQYYTLYCIYEATSSKSNEYIISSGAFQDDDDIIPGWKISTGWLSNNLDPCDGGWFGVACDTTGQEIVSELFEQQQDVEGKIVNLDLFDNSLTGNFPPEVVLLASDGFYATGAGSLVALDIFNNEYMSNNNDSSWISDLGSQLGKFHTICCLPFCSFILKRHASIYLSIFLRVLILSPHSGYLYFQNTMFAGSLPSKFPNGLIELDIANSMITGPLVGKAFEDLTSLRFLLMDGVQFNSSIPTEIASLPNLEYLFATDAMITGDLSYMEDMSIIFEHWVDRNPMLGGTIPDFIGTLTTLQSFSIAECNFVGTIPESIGNLALMQQMWLYGNQLSGEIPASIGDLKFIRIFQVEDNNLSDSMPESICDNFSTGMLEVLGADCEDVDVSSTQK